MIQIAICDDEEIAVKFLADSIRKIAEDNKRAVNIKTFLSGEQLEKMIERGVLFDILLLDIHMNNMDGLETARRIRQIDENMILIYVSSDDEYLREIFQYNVFEFIKKPIETARLEAIILRACNKVNTWDNYFYYQVNREKRRSQIKDIMWFESIGRKIVIHCHNGNDVMFTGKLDEIEDKMDNSNMPFLRIHKSYLVNFNMIEKKNQKKLEMRDGTELIISEDRRDRIKNEYSRLLGGEISV